VLRIADVRKDYSGLRPLRIQALTVAPAERVAVVGLDAAAGELLVNLVTGAALPDQGSVSILGDPTSAITDGDGWLASLDRFGIAGDRAVLMQGATVAQNLATPFTLEIDPIPAEIRRKVDRLAEECGIVDRSWLDRLAGELPPDLRARVHLARAVALEPALLLLEHLTAPLADAARDALAADVVRVTEARRLATLIITHDTAFAWRVSHRALTLQPATGILAPLKRGWFR
jgi:ABC-type nitrate/sulfonate/bicarbonate transport system ATPase subunit